MSETAVHVASGKVRELFELDDAAEVAVVLQEQVPPDQTESAREAEDACPAAAIIVSD